MSALEFTNELTTAAPVDFMALLDRCLGNFQMVERVLSTFRITGRSYLEKLQQAIESADFQAVAEIAHRFRGAASNVSVTGIRELLKETERLAQERDHDELLTILGRVRSAWEQFESYSEAFAPAVSKPIKQTQTTLERSHAGACR